ncbi:MAG: extracellular solute-binding protein [Lachnospiraceae bacterium]|nr:extracellular solute-binding protein [Lachnospiraceae bacterium]
MRRYLFGLAVFLLGTILAGCGGRKIKTFTCFVATSGQELPENNRVMNAIAEKIGAKAEISYLSGQTDKEYISAMIQKGEYPDFIDGMNATSLLLEAGAYIPLDGYLEKYPDLKNLLTDEEWNRMRQSDGHIYFIPQFYTVNGKVTICYPPDEAFWIQKRVLKWAGYPTIRTLDEYFDLIERYLKEHPLDENGEKNTGFEILCEDWRYFCLENVPQFLAGYPNDGCAIVDPETNEVSVYDTIPQARQYYEKLNREFHLGVIERETFTQSYQQYLEKLSQGNVLGMVDQRWQFQEAEWVLNREGKDDRTYVPLSITADASIQGAYTSKAALNTSNGLGISVSCEDVEGALQFLNDLLKPEIMTLRYWGEEGIDYETGKDGVFYRTDDQWKHAGDSAWLVNNMCQYSYFPHYLGMLEDGINTVDPAEQPREFYRILNETDREVLDAYGFRNWMDFLNEPAEENAPWFPLYSATNNWTADTAYGKAKEEMDEVKHEWLPKVIMSAPEEFDAVWEQYMDVYHTQVDIAAYEEELEREVARRIAAAKGK